MADRLGPQADCGWPAPQRRAAHSGPRTARKAVDSAAVLVRRWKGPVPQVERRSQGNDLNQIILWCIIRQGGQVWVCL